MNVLILNSEAMEKLKALRAFAERNRVTMDDLLDILNRDRQPPGGTDGYWCEIPMDYKVVLTIEEQPEVLVRHMSISRRNRKLPSVPVVEEIMECLGFEGEIRDCVVYMEEGYAINVTEIIK